LQTFNLSLSYNFIYFLAEFGDFNPHTYSSTFASEFRFHPLQNEQMELAILRQWADKQLEGMNPCRAEASFLDKARKLPLYGVDLVFFL